MRLQIFLTTALFLFSCKASAAGWEMQKTHGLIVGVLQWKDPGLAPFSNVHRKDSELHRTLLARGVRAERLGLLLDSQATAAAIEAGIRRAASDASPESVFFFYYAGHGIKDPTGIYLANYDIDSARPSAHGIRISRIAELIAENFKGSTVILSGDFCYSGAFEEALRSLAAKGKRGFVLASSTASNESTGNWTFSQTLIDCISGSPFCDGNEDGRVTLGEAAAETAMSMKFRERQRSSFRISGLDDSIEIAKTRGARPTGSGGYVLAPSGAANAPARILSRQASMLTVEFFSYSEKRSVTVEERLTRPLEFRTYSPGSTVNVLWNRKAYPARVLKVEDGFHLIRYDGYDSSWDEWVMDDRIADGEAVLVEWKGGWYPARILKREGGRAFVRYEGYGNEWDEWVTQARMRAR